MFNCTVKVAIRGKLYSSNEKFSTIEHAEAEALRVARDLPFGYVIIDCAAWAITAWCNGTVEIDKF